MSGLEKGAWVTRHDGNCSFLHTVTGRGRRLGAACSPAFISHRAEAGGMAEKDTPDFDEEVVFEVREKWRCVWVAFVWEGRGRRREADRGSEGAGDAPAVLGHRISSISGPSAGRCLTGVARGALASPSLCLRAPPRIPSLAGGREPCVFLPGWWRRLWRGVGVG